MILRFFGHGRRDQGSPDGAGADGVDTDALGDLLVMQSTCEGHDGAFGGGVVEQVGAADVCVDGRAIVDGVAALHVLEGVLGEVEEGVDVGVEGLEPLISEMKKLRISVRTSIDSKVRRKERRNLL